MLSVSRSSLLAIVALSLLTMIVYAGAFQNDFVDFDDNIYVFENAETLNGLTVDGLRYAWTTFESGNWIPLTWMSYQLDASLFGRSAWGFHLTNLCLHALNVILIFAWWLRVTANPLQAFAIAALFSVHPLHVESVAWIAERKDVLSTLFLLVTLFAYEGYCRRPAVSKYLVVCVLFVLGLLAKSMLVTLPLLLLLIDFWPLKRFPPIGAEIDRSRGDSRRHLKRLLLEKIPLLLLSVADGVITMIAQDATQARWPLAYRLANVISGYAWYLKKTVWPVGLCVYYPHPADHVNWTSVFLASALLIACSVCVVLAGRRTPQIWFGWIWYWITLLPVIGLIQVGYQAHADRYSYVPHIGLLAALVAVICDRFSQSVPGRRFFVAILVVVIGVCGWLSMKQIHYWKSTETLWARALEVDPDNWFAHLQLGNRQATAGCSDEEASEHLKRALQHDPKHLNALNNLGWVYQLRRDWTNAEEYYRRALEVNPEYAIAMHNLVTVWKMQGTLPANLDWVIEFIRRHPNDAFMQYELGMYHVRAGRTDAARQAFAKAVAAEPGHLKARNNLALTLFDLGLLREAKLQFELLLEQSPHDVNARVNFGHLLEKIGDLAEARNQYAQALKDAPNDAEARQKFQTLGGELQ